jgi:hypothetical protein
MNWVILLTIMPLMLLHASTNSTGSNTTTDDDDDDDDDATLDEKLDWSALFSDMTPTDVFLLVLVLIIILLIVFYLLRKGARSRQRLLQVRDSERTYAQSQIDHQVLPAPTLPAIELQHQTV